MLTHFLFHGQACKYRQNQISAMLAYSRGGYCPQNCTMLVQADQGTRDILPTIHCKSVKMYCRISDFVYCIDHKRAKNYHIMKLY